MDNPAVKHYKGNFSKRVDIPARIPWNGNEISQVAFFYLPQIPEVQCLCVPGGGSP